jgi:cytochrome c-type biogenesis protein CcmE
MKPAGWVGLAIILAAITFSAKAFVSNVTPYLPFGEARKATAQVQVMGALDKTSVVNKGTQLSFTIVSTDGDRMPVCFTQAAPANFSMATQVTAIGKFDGQVFRADSLLTKCPSKYQGKENETREYTSRAAAPSGV